MTAANAESNETDPQCTKNAEANDAGAKAAHEFMDGPSTTAYDHLQGILKRVPIGARDYFQAGFINALADTPRRLTANDSASALHPPADLGPAIPDLLRRALLAVADARRLLRITGRTAAARRSIDKLVALADTIDGDGPGLHFDMDVTYLVPGPGLATRAARDELRALRPSRIRLLAMLADPAPTELRQDA